MSIPSQYDLAGVFNEVAQESIKPKAKKKKKPKTVPIYVHVTEEEKAALQKMERCHTLRFYCIIEIRKYYRTTNSQN